MSLSEQTNGTDLSLQEQRLLFTQFQLMLSSGVGLVESLDAIARAPGGAGAASAAVARWLCRGVELESAFARASPDFERLAVGLIKLGRKTGSLTEVLKRLALRAEERCRRQEQLRAALSYPLGILAVAILKASWIGSTARNRRGGSRSDWGAV